MCTSGQELWSPLVFGVLDSTLTRDVQVQRTWKSRYSLEKHFRAARGRAGKRYAVRP